AIYQLTDVVNADGDKLSYRYDDVGNVTHVIDPKKNTTPDTTDFTTHTTYDDNHRPKTVTDAAGETTETTYDKDSLVIATTDQADKTIETDYDERGLPEAQRVPYDSDAGTVRTTKFTYDQAGNRTKVETPRGVNTATPDDFTHRTTYDELNRPWRQHQPYDPNDARYNNPDVYTETIYDEVGRVKTVSAPPSEGQTVRNETTYEYFDTGWIRTSTDPWEIKTEYDYNDLGQQKSRVLTSRGGSSKRPMGWAYYPDGSLAARTDEGVPADQQTVLVDNSDTQNTSTSGEWTRSRPKTDTRASQGYDHHTRSAGADASFTWRLNVPATGDYTAYVKYPEATGKAVYEVTHAKGKKDTKHLNQSAKAGTWVALGTYDFAKGNNGKITLTGDSTGEVRADAVKLVRDNPQAAAGDDENKNFSYRYDRNGNLTDIDDTSSGAKIDAYTMAYTGLNQVAKVTENLAGDEKTATAFTYDANGQTETVTHPSEYQAYTYDLRELVKTVKVGDTPDDPTLKTTTYTYTPRGQKDIETKANGNILDTDYYANGTVKTTRETNDGALVASHAYDWDPNGNKARDITSKMNADNHGAYLDSTTTYTYDPIDRIREVTKTGNGASTESYVHDDNANVISQSVKGVDTTYTYDQNRLLEATTEGTPASYNYDPYGRLDTVTADNGQIIERNTYDGFDHIAEHTALQDDGTTKTTQYQYDPLDRTTSKTDNNGKTTDYNYLGTSNEVLDESVAGEVTKSYQYSPWGERLSQITHKSDGTQELGVYGYNSHTDVETLTDTSGNTKATYGYTAYGNNDESEFTGIDKPDAGAPDREAYNPYRFNAKRWDAAAETYDMGFRDYDPGLNRFLTRDMYNGALADMQLGTDPATGNRYAFTGGNPTTKVELDGHCPTDVCGGGYPIGGADSGEVQPLAEGTAAYQDYKAPPPAKSSIARGEQDSELRGSIRTALRAGAAAARKLPGPLRLLGMIPDSRHELSDELYRKIRKEVADKCFNSNGRSEIVYGRLDGEGRATGVAACLGPYTSHKINTTGPQTPRGYKKNSGMDRSHLLAREFGGSHIRENIVPMASHVNQEGGGMRDIENRVGEMLDKRETVSYSATPVYGEASLRPIGVQYYIYSSGGQEIEEFVPSEVYP
ncbi:golvesin C-terminal-like domain-containing protein, partial [Streptomyces aculeolatus]